MNLWAMEPAAFAQMAGLVARIDLSHPPQQAADSSKQAARKPYTVSGGVAVIPIEGLLISNAPYWFKWLGRPVADPNAIKASVQAAVVDPEVRTIVLRVDSPGGSTEDVDSTANAIYAARQRKPIHAHVDNLGASAAYRIASQATRISASPAALVGSIGTYLAVEDWSRYYEARGISVRVVKAGDYKAAGVEGTEITAAQLVDLQRIVDGVNSLFVRGVAQGRGRPLSWAEARADGRLWLADSAQGLGLIDEVAEFDAVMARLSAASAPAPKPVRPAAGTVATSDVQEFKSDTTRWPKFGRSGGSWGLITSGQSGPDVARPLAEETRSIPVSQTTNQNRPNAEAEWDRRLQAKMAAGRSKAAAIKELVREDPELHRQYLAAYNQRFGR